MKAPIHSVKHYVQTSFTLVATGAKLDIVLVDAQALQNVNAVFEVQEGALVKAIYIELWVLGDTADATQITCLAKHPASAAPFTTTQLAGIGNASNKKNVLFFSQGLASNDGIANPINIMRGWYKIPRSKQRFGLGDTLELQIFAQGAAGLEVCGFATYKEYT